MYRYQFESAQAEKKLAKIAKGTIAMQEHQLGVANNEPLLIIADSLLRYAKAYRTATGRVLANDAYLGDVFLDTLTNFRRLNDGQGAVAMEKQLSSDSKDSGLIEDILMTALYHAGFDPAKVL